MPLTKLKNLLREIRSALWFRPTVWSFLVVVLMFAIARLDRAIPQDVISAYPAIATEAVKDMLRLMAGGMLTVTTVALSVTMVVLNLATSQASPRAVPELMADAVTQNALSTFLATFVFSIAALAAFGYGAINGAGVTMVFVAASALGLWSIRYLVHWMHHVANSSKLNMIIAKVYEQADASLSHYLSMGQEAVGEFPAVEPADGIEITATSANFVQLIDVARLQKSAEEMNLYVHLHVREGDFIHPQMVIMTAWGDANDKEKMSRRLSRCLAAGRERTPEGDPRLGAEVLSEIACRALSPSMNDPQSALVALNYLGALLARAGAVKMSDYPKASVKGGRIKLRVIGFEQFLIRALRPAMRDGAGQAEIACHILKILRDLGRTASPDYFGVIREEAERATEQARNALGFAADRQAINDALAEVEDSIARRQ